MLLNNRHGQVDSDAYRYGFQGQERDDEVKGEGNSYNYTFRMHDPRLGRFFAVDPLSHKFAWYSSYLFAGNTVIMAREYQGMYPIVEGGKIVGYVVEAGQGPTQIAKDINNPATQKKHGYTLQEAMTWSDVVYSNYDTFNDKSHVKNLDDKNDPAFRTMNINEGEELKICNNCSEVGLEVVVTGTKPMNNQGIDKDAKLRIKTSTIADASIINWSNWSIEASNDTQLGFWDRKYKTDYGIGFQGGFGATDAGLFTGFDVDVTAHRNMPGTDLLDVLKNNSKGNVIVGNIGATIHYVHMSLNDSQSLGTFTSVLSGHGIGGGISAGIAETDLSLDDLQRVPLSKKDSIEIAKKDLKIPESERNAVLEKYNER